MAVKGSVNASQARSILAGASGAKRFFLANNGVVSDYYQLYRAFKEIDDQTFSHHLNPSRNDFSAWVKGVFMDEALGAQLSGSKTRSEAAQAVFLRIRELQKVINSSTSLTANSPVPQSSENVEPARSLKEKLSKSGKSPVLLLPSLSRNNIQGVRQHDADLMKNAAAKPAAIKTAQRSAFPEHAAKKQRTRSSRREFSLPQSFQLPEFFNSQQTNPSSVSGERASFENEISSMQRSSVKITAPQPYSRQAQEKRSSIPLVNSILRTTRITAAGVQSSMTSALSSDSSIRNSAASQKEGQKRAEHHMFSVGGTMVALAALVVTVILLNVFKLSSPSGAVIGTDVSAPNWLNWLFLVIVVLAIVAFDMMMRDKKHGKVRGADINSNVAVETINGVVNPSTAVQPNAQSSQPAAMETSSAFQFMFGEKEENFQKSAIQEDQSGKS